MKRAFLLLAALASQGASQQAVPRRLAAGSPLYDFKAGVRLDWHAPAAPGGLSRGSRCGGGSVIQEGAWPPLALDFVAKIRLFTFFPDGVQLSPSSALASDPGATGWLAAVLSAASSAIVCSAAEPAAARLLLSRGTWKLPSVSTTSTSSDTLAVPLTFNLTSKLSQESDDAISPPLAQVSLSCSLANASLFVPFDASAAAAAAVATALGATAASDVPLAGSSTAVTLWTSRWAVPSTWSALPSYTTPSSWPCSPLAPERCDAPAAWFSAAASAALPLDVVGTVGATGQATVMSGQPVLLLKRLSSQGGSFPSGGPTRGTGAPLLGLQVQQASAPAFASLADFAANAGDRSVIALRLPRSDFVCPLSGSTGGASGGTDGSNSSSSGGSGSSSGSGGGAAGANGLRRTGPACAPQTALLTAASPSALSSAAQLAAVCAAVASANLSAAVAAGVAYRSGVVACPPFCSWSQLPSDATIAPPSAAAASQPVIISSASTAAAYDALHSAAAAGGIRGSSGELLAVQPLSAAAAVNAIPPAAGFAFARPCISPGDPSVLTALQASGAPTLSALCANASTASPTVCFWGEPPDCVPCPLGGLCPGEWRFCRLC